MPIKVDWANTPGYARNYGNELAGMPIHAIPDGTGRSLCGLRRKEWAVDLHNTERCKRCQRIINKANTLEAEQFGIAYVQRAYGYAEDGHMVEIEPVSASWEDYLATSQTEGIPAGGMVAPGSHQQKESGPGKGREE